MAQSVGFVLLHGAGLGSWIWRDLQPLLDYPVLAIDYPGRDTPDRRGPSLTLNEYCDHVREQIQEWKVENVVLAAHSVGGILALKLANQLAGRVIGVVGISATIPLGGGSFVSTLPFLKRMLMHVLLRTAGTKPPKKAIIQTLCNDLPKDQAEEIADRFVPESRHLYLDRCEVQAPDVDRIYIRTLRDREYSAEFQDIMIRNLSPQKVISLESGHLPMMRCPAELAGVMNQFIKDCRSLNPDISDQLDRKA